ncbi:Phosphate transporter PHO1 -like protein 9 [Capsicum annuum]|uniref:Phosphate transporter PHO1 -like protein 9 n=1 Tax=Capsicum annuum TaxID=4072 RepID=A0A2G3ACD4_CAPAN|nr:phosphate transporter PHO1 homolog 3 [Capsicum annuum]PHT91897.1 Phosphate transporter PHO1 -like protein 9 [Capsicum annuum]
MKFGKEYASQMVHEWQEAYMDYNYLKSLLSEILSFKQKNAPLPEVAATPRGSLKRKLSMYKAFSGLQVRYNSFKGKNNHEDEVIVVNSVQQEGSECRYETTFLVSCEEVGECELLFFRNLDDEFNKVLNFYQKTVGEVRVEAGELSKQMDALIALRIKVDNISIGMKSAQVMMMDPSTNDDSIYSPASADPVRFSSSGRSHMEAIQEVEMTNDENLEEEAIQEVEMTSEEILEEEATAGTNDTTKMNPSGFRPAPLEVLDYVKINIEPETPISTLKSCIMTSKSHLTFSKEELKKAEEQMKKAFVEFYQKLRLLKSYRSLNMLAFSKIMKKYDKITSRKASKSYLEMIEKSYLGSSDEVYKLIAGVEATFTKHFVNGNRRKGMKYLRPQAKRERHRVTFFTGLFSGCSLALVAAIAVSVRAGNLLEHEGRGQYMENIFPLYSLFGFIVLHMLMYAGNIYYWRVFRVNYPFIFGFKQGTELGYRQVLLLTSGLSVLALAAALYHLDMDIDPKTRSFETVTELTPLALVIVLLLIAFCPLNIIYRSSRFFFIRCVWHCLCAPLYKVTLPDFFLADQFTSQVQAIRSLQFYVCYYAWGNFKTRSNTCQDSHVYSILYIFVAIIPFWSRFLQCLRRLFEEKDSMQGFNSLKYLSTIIALVMRTLYDQKRGTFWKVMAASTSGITTVANTYWDLVIDWGLLRRNSRNPWLRDKLLVPHKIVYFVAIVLDIILRLVWMQLVLDIRELPGLHPKAFIAIVACLEILRRGMWNFFRLENEHLNNVGKYRASKSVPLPFNYDEDKSM